MLNGILVKRFGCTRTTSCLSPVWGWPMPNLATRKGQQIRSGERYRFSPAINRLVKRSQSLSGGETNSLRQECKRITPNLLRARLAVTPSSNGKLLMRCVVVLQLRGTLQRRSYIREDRIRRRDLREAG